MGAQKTLIQKTYKIQIGSESLNVDFLDANEQIDWIEISIVPDKCDEYKTIYDSYNRDMAAQLIQTLKLTNFTELYSLTNEKSMLSSICSISNFWRGAAMAQVLLR